MDKEKDDLLYAAFEGEMTRAEMRDKRKDRIIALLIIIVLVSNLAWLCFFDRFNFTSETVSQELDSGNANYIGADGTINNGEADSK